MTKPLPFLLLLAALMLGLVGLVNVGFDRCAQKGTPTSAGARVGDDGTLAVVGGIDGQMLAAVRQQLANTARPVRRISLDSGGGLVAPMQELAQMLMPLGAVVAVDAGNTCQSACVGLLAAATAAADRIAIAPTATLMFHASATAIGLAETGPCGWLNAITRWLARELGQLAAGLGSTSGRPPAEPVMLPWARSLSDKLPVLFALCPVDPLTSTRGITLTGAEFNGLRDGSIEPDQLRDHCPPS